MKMFNNHDDYFLEKLDTELRFNNYVPSFLKEDNHRIHTDNRSPLYSRGSIQDVDFSNKPESIEIKLPLNPEHDLKGCSSLIEMRDRMESGKVEYVSIYTSPEYNGDSNRKIDGVLWIKLPEVTNDMKYVPIIVYNGGGIDFYPDSHKYFLRAFKDKKVRHTIIGYCYEYGNSVLITSYFAGRYSGGKYSTMDQQRIQDRALRYRDSDAPKRIDFGPKI